jgi:hypothetical protein
MSWLILKVKLFLHKRKIKKKYKNTWIYEKDE